MQPEQPTVDHIHQALVIQQPNLKPTLIIRWQPEEVVPLAGSYSLEAQLVHLHELLGSHGVSVPLTPPQALESVPDPHRLAPRQRGRAEGDPEQRSTRRSSPYASDAGTGPQHPDSRQTPAGAS